MSWSVDCLVELVSLCLLSSLLCVSIPLGWWIGSRARNYLDISLSFVFMPFYPFAIQLRVVFLLTIFEISIG